MTTGDSGEKSIHARADGAISINESVEKTAVKRCLNTVAGTSGSDCNRCFIVRNFLDYLGVAYTDLTDDDMLAVAEMVAAIIRDGLYAHFPDVRFDVEIVGGNLIDDEPLELCVTFSRAA